MKLGLVSLWRDSVADFIEELRTAEALGFDLIGVGDSQAGYRELYVSLAVAAMHTERVMLGPVVTNPVTRHPAVTVGAIASVDRLCGARAFLGLGTGGSAVWNLGRAPARIDDFRAYVVAVKALMAEGRAEFDGATVTMDGITRPVPIYVSAEGPRALRLAGALADGVILHSGTSPQALAWCLGHLADGAETAGRDPGEIDVWMMLKASVAGSRAEAIQEVKMGLAGSAEHALRNGAAEKGIPPELLDAVRELVSRYDPTQHGVALSANGDLVDELGLTEVLADLFGLVGTPAECAQRLRDLEALGVAGVVCPALGSDPLALIRRLGEDVRGLLAVG